MTSPRDKVASLADRFRTKPVNDPSKLPADARAGLDVLLGPDEHFQLVQAGADKDFLVITTHRVAIWKRKLGWNSWQFDELSRLELELGGFQRFVTLHGPSIPERRLTVYSAERESYGVRIGRQSSDETTVLEQVAAHIAEQWFATTPPDWEIYAEGAGSSLWAYSDRIRIRHWGMRSFFTQGFFRGEKEIPYESITAVEWREPGSMTVGFIQFTILGGVTDAKKAVFDENAVPFNPNQVDVFRAAKAHIDGRLRSLRASRSGGAAPARPDVAEQLRQLRKLRDEGIVNEEEFAAKKRELLDRM
jgi:hypothetical protein